MIERMQSGSVIYDLAAIQGGNTSFTEKDKVIEKNGVSIMGDTNILNKLPTSASSLYSKMYLILLLICMIKIIKK